MLVILFVIILTLLYVWFFIYNNRIRRMAAHIPGPTPLPIIGTLYCGFNKTEILDTLRRLEKKYGNVFGLWFGNNYTVAISDPKDMEIILKHNVEVNKSYMYEKLLPWLGKGLLSAESHRWRKTRKILTPAFHFKILDSFIPIFNKNATILTSILHKNLETDVDMLKYISKFAFDSLCETAMGVQMNSQLEEHCKFIESTEQLADLTTHRASSFLLYFEWIYNLTSTARKIRELTIYMNSVVDSVIRERQKVLSSKSTEHDVDDGENVGQRKLRSFMDLLLEYKKSGEVTFTDEDIRDEIHTFMFAGHDTTKLAISFFCYGVSQNPEVQERLIEEQRAIFGDLEDPNIQVTSSDLAEMKYLEKTIKESLRVYPTVVYVTRTLENDLQLSNGIIVPAGATVMPLLYATHLNSEVFPDPLKFDPDHFDSPHISSQPFSYVPFSAGPRNCIGQRYAMLQMKVVLSHLLRNFQILPSSIPLKMCFTILLNSETGVNVKLKSRKTIH